MTNTVTGWITLAMPVSVANWLPVTFTKTSSSSAIDPNWIFNWLSNTLILASVVIVTVPTANWICDPVTGTNLSISILTVPVWVDNCWPVTFV